MKFKDYVKLLTNLAKEHPEIKDMKVVYSRDDEGNYYGEVYYSPSIGVFNNGEFDSEEDANANCVCIN